MMPDSSAFPNGLVISAPSSGTGKTTVMLGLLRLFTRQGIKVHPFKSGPDYIDPAFHQAACGTASANLDGWAMSEGLLDHIASQAQPADLILAEGSMGLFDGVASPGETATGATAEISIRYGWPVILVLDVSGQAQSAAATALGFKSYHPELHLAGVILNRVASPRHDRLCRAGMEKHGIQVLGALPKRGDLSLPERHLGLIQAAEHPDLEQAITDYADFLAEHIDEDAILCAAAHSHHPQPYLDACPPPPAQKIALAQDEAFSFTYPHLIAGWRQMGAEILPFSPLLDEAPDPDADLIWLAGGYPELHAGRLAQADRCFNAIRAHAAHKPVHGECGGYMVLGQYLTDKAGERHQMLGLLGLETSFEKRQFHLGYRLATRAADTAAFASYHRLGIERLRGHEFHYSRILEQPDKAIFDVQDATGRIVAETGSMRGQVSGTFFHLIATAN